MKFSGIPLRGTVALVVLIVIGAGAIAATGWVFSLPPDPQTASREAIFRWLVLGDVAQQSTAMQVALVDRLESELNQEFSASTADLSSTQQQTLERNVSTLKRLWFVDRSRHYGDLEVAERFSYMDARVQTVMAWSTMESTLQSNLHAGSPVFEFFDEIQHWMESETDLELRQEMSAAVNDGILRWLSTYSLEEQPFATRTELALRIASEFETGMSIDNWNLSQTDADELKQLQANCEMLTEAWVRHHAKTYAALDDDRRPDYLTEQIDNFVQSNVIELLSSGEEAQAAMVRLLGLCEKWVSAAPAEEQGQVRQLLSAVQMELLRRKLRS